MTPEKVQINNFTENHTSTNSAIPTTVLQLSAHLTSDDFQKLMAQAKANNMLAQVTLGNMYLEGDSSVTKDYQQAMYWFRKAADQGDPIGQRKVGYLYDNGLGIPRNEPLAIEWYTKAAEQGNPGAQFSLGIKSWHGSEGVKMDGKKAMEWFQKAAEQGDPEAQHNLGLCYIYTEDDEFIDRGVEKDDAKGLELLLKAAVQGFSDAQYAAGFVYMGLKEYTKAMIWFQKAAEQKHPAAQNRIGDMYLWGHGVPEDVNTARQWYLKAANQGFAEAQYKLGLLYEGGEGIPRDVGQAIDWYDKAASQGYIRAKQRLYTGRECVIM
ncbi:hypothetical protein FBU30_011060 [Linnemannia zychae]|nr:hypothetical protein FBU30_011060 [Linnemannia zychae]